MFRANRLWALLCIMLLGFASANPSADYHTIKSIQVGGQGEYGARTMPVATKTHREFMPSADWGPAAAPAPDNPTSPRARVVPSSFRMIAPAP